MTRHADFEINILLGTVDKGTKNRVDPKEDYFKIIHDAYTTQYLEALGVEPSERYRKVVARNAPLEKCEIDASWQNDLSSLASQLRIVQPPVGRGAAAKAAESESAQAKAADQKIIEQFHGRDRKVTAAPPEVAALTLWQGRASDAPSKTEDPREQLMHAMQVRDSQNSEGVDARLVEEMERQQTLARGDEGASRAGEPVLVQWGEEGQRELDNLKRKFIVPFACERIASGPGTPGKAGSAMVPWQSPALLAASQIQVPEEHLTDLRQHLNVTTEEILEEVQTYAEISFPLELLSTRRDPWLFAGIRERLQSADFVRLIGLSAHLLYWTVFGHLHPPDKQLPESSRQSLVLTMQELWSRACESAGHKMGRKGDSSAREFVIPVFMLMLKRSIENVFTYQYRKVFTDQDIGESMDLQLVDQINVMVMNLFDPDCAHSNFGALDTSTQAMKLWRKLHIIQMKLGLTPATRTLAREFRTTPMMLLLMHGDPSGPSNPKTRKFLQRSSSDTVLAAVAGLPPIAPQAKRTLDASQLDHASPSPGRGGSIRQVRPNLDRHRYAALHRTACGRLSSAGQQAISGGSSASASP